MPSLRSGLLLRVHVRVRVRVRVGVDFTIRSPYRAEGGSGMDLLTYILP